MRPWRLHICLCAVLLASCVFVTPSFAKVLNITTTYRRFINATHDPAWEDGTDALSQLGFRMDPVQSGTLNAAVEKLESSLGNIKLEAGPPFYKMDFYQTYHLSTFWPYCQGLTKCLVYSQQKELQAATDTFTLHLPKAAQAVDFYVDLAIDCETVLAITAVCTATAYPGPVSITTELASVCGSPFVGTYFGFYNPTGRVHSVTVSCGSTYARAVGLLRVGALQGGSTVWAIGNRMVAWSQRRGRRLDK